MTMTCEGQKGQREAEIEAGGCPERRNSRRKGGGHVDVATVLRAGVWRPPWHRPCSLAGWRGSAGHACRKATQQAAGPGGMPSLGGRRGCTGCRVRPWNPHPSLEQGTQWRSIFEIMKIKLLERTCPSRVVPSETATGRECAAGRPPARGDAEVTSATWLAGPGDPGGMPGPHRPRLRPSLQAPPTQVSRPRPPSTVIGCQPGRPVQWRVSRSWARS